MKIKTHPCSPALRPLQCACGDRFRFSRSESRIYTPPRIWAGVSAIAAVAALALTAPAFAGIAEKEYLDTSKWDVGDYVQDGLIVHYDGIRNVGADAAHSDTTTVWSNLGDNSTNKDMEWSSFGYSSLSASRGKKTKGAWASNGFVFDGEACWIKWNNGGANPVVVPDQYTMQFAMTANTADQTGSHQTGYIFFPHKDFGYQKGSVAIRSTANGDITAANAVFAVDQDRLGSTSIRPQFVNPTPRYATVRADTAALRTFEGTTLPESGESGYAAITGSSSSRSMNVIALGGFYDRIATTKNDFQGFTGTLHNFRLYGRALEPAELERNRIVDDARFFGVRHPVAVTNAVVASTYSFLDGTEPAGFYTVEGSHEFTAPSGEITAANGITYRCIGHTLETWSDATQTWGDPVQHDGSLAVAVSSSDLKRITWLWKPVHGIRTAAKYSLADYSQAGLILHYDGIHNDGADAEHSITTTKWLNIAPGHESDWPAYWASYVSSGGQDNEGYELFKRIQNDNTQGKWGDNGFVFNGQVAWMKWNEGTPFFIPANYTMQFALDADIADMEGNAGTIGYLFAPHDVDYGWANGSVAVRSSANGNVTPANAVYSVDQRRLGSQNIRPHFADPSPNFVTTMADSTALRTFGGTSIPVSGDTGYATIEDDTQTRRQKWFALGAIGSSNRRLVDIQGLVGTLHSFRIYDRPLTQEEVERNINTDSARFFGALATTNVVVEIGNTDGQITATPEAGAYKVEGSYDFTASGDVTGYKLEAWNDATGDWDAPTYCEGTTFSYTADTPSKLRLTWRKSLPFVLVVR